MTDAFHAEPGIDADQKILDPCCAVIGQDLQDDMRQVREREQQYRSMEELFSPLARQTGKHHGPPEQEAEGYDEPACQPQPDSGGDGVRYRLKSQPGRKDAAADQGRPQEQQPPMFPHAPIPEAGKQEQEHARTCQRVHGPGRHERDLVPGEDIERQQGQAQKGARRGPPQAQTGEAIHQKIPCTGTGPGHRTAPGSAGPGKWRYPLSYSPAPFLTSAYRQPAPCSKKMNSIRLTMLAALLSTAVRAASSGTAL